MYPPSELCLTCSGSAKPGTVALMQYMMNRFPYTSSMGIYACRNVAGTNTKSQHSCGRAWDCGVKPLSSTKANTALGHPIIVFLYKYSTQFGIVEIIYDRVIYDDKTPGGRYYGGVHPHYDHLHITQTQAAALNLNYADYVRIAGDPKEGPLMTLLPIQYGHGYKTPPADSDLAGDQTYKTQDVIYLQNLLKRCGWTGDIDGVYGPGTMAGVNEYGGGQTGGKITTGWLLDNIQAAAWAKLFSKVGHGHPADPPPPVQPHDHDGRYLKSVTGVK